MFKIIDTDGHLQTSEGIDINVWYDEETSGVRLTAYPMDKNSDGFWDTNTNSVLFWAVTDFTDYGDEWFGYSDDMMPGDMPTEVLALVEKCISEVDLPEMVPHLEDAGMCAIVLSHETACIALPDHDGDHTPGDRN